VHKVNLFDWTREARELFDEYKSKNPLSEDDGIVRWLFSLEARLRQLEEAAKE
jgi:hypothetical protein